jgi:hypothetical protein
MFITNSWCREVLSKVAFNGPLPKDYPAVSIAIRWAYENIPKPQDWFLHTVITPHKQYVDMRNAFHPPNGPKVYDLLLHIWNKGEHGTTPRGYNGDGDLLQKLYDCHDKPDYGHGDHVLGGSSKSLWDHYICARSEVLSLQFRREMFRQHVRQFFDGGARSFVDLGCGNGSYTLEAFGMLQGLEGVGHCIGIDSAEMPVSPIGTNGPLFMRTNVLNNLPNIQCDVVYSGGLFDYFSD